MIDFKAKLTSIKDLTQDVKMFVFERPEGFEFKAGQFVMIKFDDEVSRAYSIASSPSDESGLSFIIKLLEGGRGSEYLRKAKEGDEFNFKGPFGHFFLNDDSEKDIVLVGTGTGIAPLYSILLSSNKKMKLFFGLRYVEDLFFQEKFKDFDCKIILSRPDESWDGEKGYVTDLIKAEDFDFEKIQVYICGSKDMVDDVKGYFLEKGVPAEDIKNEVY